MRWAGSRSDCLLATCNLQPATCSAAGSERRLLPHWAQRGLHVAARTHACTSTCMRPQSRANMCTQRQPEACRLPLAGRPAADWASPIDGAAWDPEQSVQLCRRRVARKRGPGEAPCVWGPEQTPARERVRGEQRQDAARGLWCGGQEAKEGDNLTLAPPPPAPPGPAQPAPLPAPPSPRVTHAHTSAPQARGHWR